MDDSKLARLVRARRLLTEYLIVVPGGPHFEAGLLALHALNTEIHLLGEVAA